MKPNPFAAGRLLPRVLAASVLAVVAGCATTGQQERHTAGPKDPLEPFNRKMFAFNDTLDHYALKPAAKTYQKVLPSPIRSGIHNFFGNFSDAWSVVNNLLQGKFGDGAVMTMRVLTNTTIGIGGLFDPATELGLDRRSQDLGLTFGHWGVPAGSYLVLPLFGSSDLRDAAALPADTYVSPALLVPSTWQKIGVDAVGVVDARAGLLGASQMLDELAFDRYTFTRDAYVTRRRSLVYDGNPPDRPDDDAEDGPAAAPRAPSPAASAAKTSMSAERADVVAQVPAPTPPGGVTPAPLPASAPTVPVPLSGPAPVPPPPASAVPA
ncbi:MAG: VacJ family lipoprotein [Burkholderiaceae bacterium]